MRRYPGAISIVLAEKFGLNYGLGVSEGYSHAVKSAATLFEIELTTGSTMSIQVPTGEYIIHPVDFDACFHGLNVVFERLKFGENKLAYRAGTSRSIARICAGPARYESARIHLISYNNPRSACRFRAVR